MGGRLLSPGPMGKVRVWPCNNRLDHRQDNEDSLSSQACDAGVLDLHPDSYPVE